MMENMRCNWKRECEQLAEPETQSHTGFKEELNAIEKNVYHKKTLSLVIIEEVFL